MGSPVLHLGTDDAPDLVTHEGLTYVVRQWDRVQSEYGRVYRVRAEGPIDWMIARFDDACVVVGGYVRCGALAAWEMWVGQEERR